MFLPFDGVSIAITPTLDISGAYTSGDVLFAATKLQSATLNTKGCAILRTLVLLDSDNQKPALDLLFFDEDPGSLGAPNASLDVSAAALAKLVGILNVATGDWTTLKGSTNAIGIKTPTLMLPAKKNSTDFWVAGVARGTPTYTVATNLTLKAILERQG